VLFGPALTIISSIIGVAAGGVQGYFGGWIDLAFQRFIEVWTAIPSLYLLLICRRCWCPASLSCSAFSCVLMGLAGGLCAPNSCAGRNFEYIMAAARSVYPTP